jgi:plastocyanin
MRRFVAGRLPSNSTQESVQMPHTATSTKKPRLFDSGTLDTDDKFSRVFTAPGTYEYFCAVHPHMTGQIIVK